MESVINNVQQVGDRVINVEGATSNNALKNNVLKTDRTDENYCAVKSEPFNEMKNNVASEGQNVKDLENREVREVEQIKEQLDGLTKEVKNTQADLNRTRKLLHTLWINGKNFRPREIQWLPKC